MNFRALTVEELSGFLERHPNYNVPNVPAEGKYIQDSALGGFVLVFKTQDGGYTFTLTDSDPSVGDPSRTGYIIRETLEEIKRRTSGVIGGITGTAGDILAGASGAVAKGLKPLTGVGIFAIVGAVIVLLYLQKAK